LSPFIKEEGGILGIIGVMNIVGMNYLAVISEAEYIGELYSASVYKISLVNLHPFN
jgi:hypothetical protein